MLAPTAPDLCSGTAASPGTTITPVTPLILLSNGRTGSTHVYRRHAARPDILMFNEVFQVSEGKGNLANGQKSVAGTDGRALAQGQLSSSRKPGPERRIRGEFEACGNIGIMRLGRRSFVAGCISAERARAASSWHHRPSHPDRLAPVRLTIEVVSARPFLADATHRARREADLQVSHPPVTFYREGQVADAPAMLRDCLDFQGVRRAGSAPAPRRTMIENLDEVDTKLDAVGIGWMIDPNR